MINTSEFKEEYLQFDADLRKRQSIIGCIVALFLVPLGGVLDFIVYRDAFSELLTIRIACSCAVGFICILHFYFNQRTTIHVLNIAWPTAISLAISLMISVVGGVSGPYYAGLNLVILGASLLLPLTLVDTLFIVILTAISYSFTYFGSPTSEINYSLLFNNSFFLFATGIICCTSSYFRSKLRMREFSLRFELNQRNVKLAEMDRVKSDFYANISHELRTPLTLILAPVEDLLADVQTSDKTRRQLAYVKENTYRLLKLVNDLLDVLRLEEKKDLLEQQPVALNSVLANIIGGMEPLAARKVIDLSYHCEDESTRILGDASAVEKIFINLVNNALKFTEAGGSVNIKLRIDGDKVKVDVVDTGVGIASEDLPHIFDRFHQVDSSATRKHQGTGLGLALVKELTELQGGQVEVSSRLGQGTTMTAEFPVLAASVLGQSEQPVVSVDAAPSGEDDGLDTLHRTANYSLAESQFEKLEVAEGEAASTEEYIGANLLIVEDEPDVRNYLAEALTPIYQVDLAMDGEEGLRKIQSNKPDLVILDLMLPIKDGLSVCEEVKKDPQIQQTKIMLLTARTDEKSKMTALEHGADDFLTKPFSTVEIKTRLKNLWKNSALQRDLATKNDDLSSALTNLKDAQGQLIQSEKLNALGRLAAGLLHEVNNPLNFAFGTFQMLEREPVLAGDETITEMMADIRVGLERIASIVKDLKTFAYPEKSDVEKVFYLRAAVDSAVRLTSKKTYNTKIHIDLNETLALKGSQSHIIQILVNLIENAVDAMTENETENPSITIFSTDHKDALRSCVHVKDNGPGISPEKVEKIFDPFFTTKDVGAGMGMGLSICHTIAKNHGGTLTVESEEGGYTDFQFDLLKDTSG